jgi:hypothetical protein
MKKVLIALPLWLLPAIAFAQHNHNNVGPSSFVGSYTLWIAVVLGVICSVITYRYASEMQGSRVGTILSLFATGMLSVALGFLSIVVAWAPANIQALSHDGLFILGYIFLLIGATRIKTLSA